MLTKSDYDKLVLMAFESLKRDIKDCEEYTVNDYNNIIAEEERKRNAQAPKQDLQPSAEPKTTPKTDKKESK